MPATHRCAGEQEHGPICAVADARAGNRRQTDALAAALAERLGCAWQAWTLNPHAPWSWFAPRWLPAAAAGFDAGFLPWLRKSAPRLLIGCGRQAALATRIGARALGVPTVQILDPRLAGPHWRLRIQPQHDGPGDARTIRTLGSLHPVDEAWLRQAREAEPALAKASSPRIVLVLGGPTRHVEWGIAELRAAVEAASARAQATGGSLLVIASRRTPQEWRGALEDVAARQWWDERDGPNPYPAWLAWADELWVSADSVNMLSEAIATAARVVVLPAARIKGRLAEFHRELFASGRVQHAAEDAALASHEPRRELAQVVDSVIERLALS